MFKKIFLSLMVMSFIATSIFAQGRQNFDRQLNPRPKLDLKEDQKNKMQTLRSELQKKQIEEKAKIQILKVEIDQLFSQDKVDVAAIKAKMEEASKHEVSLKMNKLNFWKSVNDFLTPEQQKIWKNMAKMLEKSKMMKKGKGRMMGNGGMMQMQRHGMQNFPHPNMPPDIQKSEK